MAVVVVAVVVNFESTSAVDLVVVNKQLEENNESVSFVSLLLLV